MDFAKIAFKNTFRAYQQRVLDQSPFFLKDNKINIVAAPGSGKTILGLELIRRLNHPCIILSPTTTIRNQWRQRFQDFFLNNEENIEDYVSCDLNHPALINSITYQALYSSIKKIAISTHDESLDYSNIELFRLIQVMGIKTICLDEAHHLQNEWQKALEQFIKGLNASITIISLTATPPYDCKPSEWDRYISINGQIDDEIFVPELVKEKTLCPHQDYIIFNYPTKEETREFKRQRLNSLQAVGEICALDCMSKVFSALETGINNSDEKIFKNGSTRNIV